MVATESQIETLTKSPLFVKYGEIYEAGDTIFTENADGNKMYIIQYGKVRISQNVKGIDHILNVLEKGDFFGEMAILDKSLRSATAFAIEKTYLLSFDQYAFVKMVYHNSNLALSILHKLSKRLRQMNNLLHDLILRDYKTLVINSLINIIKMQTNDGEGETVLNYKETLLEISNQLDIEDKIIEQTLKYMESINILKIDKRELKVIDYEQLARIDNLYKRKVPVA